MIEPKKWYRIDRDWKDVFVTQNFDLKSVLDLVRLWNYCELEQWLRVGLKYN